MPLPNGHLVSWEEKRMVEWELDLEKSKLESCFPSSNLLKGLDLGPQRLSMAISWTLPKKEWTFQRFTGNGDNGYHRQVR